MDFSKLNTEMKFSPGTVVTTRGVADLLEEHGIPAHMKLTESLSRHVTGDWGNLCDEDKKANDDALEHGERILSTYDLMGEKIYIITEWDRSVTTVLFPSEY